MQAALSGSALVRTVVIAVETRSAVEFVDITDRLSRIVRETGLGEGFLVVQTRHSSDLSPSGTSTNTTTSVAARASRPVRGGTGTLTAGRRS
jgi:hypothetical protein